MDKKGRTTAFEAWVVRMLVKSLKMEESEAKKWVEMVVIPNELSTVHELAVAANVDVTPCTGWVTQWPVADADLLNRVF